jgi:hypothetical protein
LKKLLAMVVVVACSKSDDKKPVAADPWAGSAVPVGSDPWAGSAAQTGSDPWAGSGAQTGSDPWTAPAEAAPAAPAAAAPARPVVPAQPASGNATAVAGTYTCQTLRYNTSVSGTYQTSYTSSAMGTFEIDGSGAYRSASYPSKGSGQTHADGAMVTFEGGPYAGFIGHIGNTSSGATIRFGGVQTQPPSESVHFNDHVCYRRQS